MEERKNFIEKQMFKAPHYREGKPLREMNLTDDFLFDVTTEDLDACRMIIELSLGIQLKELQWKEGQKVVHNLPGKRGIRMDFCARDEQDRIFDVEMQKDRIGHLPKRTRFYQALWDAPLLESGERGFDHLNPIYIIMICDFDPYDRGKYRYTFDNRCQEAPDLVMGDDCTKVFLNTKGINRDEVEPSLVEFLHYVTDSNSEALDLSCDERLKDLHRKVQAIKASEEMEVVRMKMEERDRLIREEGIEFGRAEGKEEGKKEGIELCAHLLGEGRKGDLEQAVADPAYLKQLFEEYQIK